MIDRRTFWLGGVAAAGVLAASLQGRRGKAEAAAAEVFPVSMSDDAWRKKLTPAQYNILRQEGTEPPFTSPLLDEHRAGIFNCVGCDQALFDSRTKFESGTGWPSFWAPIDKAVGKREDSTLGMVRTEVHCSRCGGHLGHVFDDGPQPTGLRYCMDGIALAFVPTAA